VTIEKVISEGYCIGCGVCKAVDPSIRIDFNKFGNLVAETPLPSPALRLASTVCPFSDDSRDETEIAASVFASEGCKTGGAVGQYRSLVAAYSPTRRAAGSSGGMVTWLLEELMRSGAVDRVIHVAAAGADSTDGRFFKFKVSNTIDEIMDGSTSFYYPVSYDEVIQYIAEVPGRYAVTGVPCFQKALRSLRAISPLYDERIVVQVGIVCGQMKSAHYMRYLSKLAGVPGEEKIVQANFRRKVAGEPANNYAFEVVSESAAGEKVKRNIMNAAIGVNWGMGYFKPNACDSCDDVFAETADVAAMDAWLPQYVKDGEGWSLIVIRSKLVEDVIRQASAKGDVVIEDTSLDDVVLSQLGGLNHRRKMLGYRQWLARKQWHPKKRETANYQYPLILRVEQRLRIMLRDRSRTVFERTQSMPITVFKQKMKPYELAHKVVTRLKSKMKRT
jgi:coenzyme F420 hydrogenase subunit beta